MKSVTKALFLTSVAAAICWVSLSYIIAGYATVRLAQPYPVEDLSQQAITTILGTMALKVLGNIFEYNDGALFGNSNMVTERQDSGIQGITNLLFIATVTVSLCWVTVSYIIAGYATVKLGQPYPVVELSQQAITTILGTAALKVLENIFEHNDGAIFGKSHKEEK